MSVDRADVDRLTLARRGVLGRIGAACARAGREPADVELVAVSKTVAPERLRAAVAAGLTTLGENRVQEAEDKVDLVPGVTWHLVGPLQKNKARRALEVFETIQAVDSVELAARLDRIAAEVRPAGRVPVYLQVNVDDDPSKAGFAPADLEQAVGSILDLARLDVRGLMTIGRLVERADDARLGPGLSMGMTDDFEVAVEEGATVVRVGRALFGERPHDHGPGHGPDHGHSHAPDGGHERA
jgi:PLP dependent protein